MRRLRRRVALTAVALVPAVLATPGAVAETGTGLGPAVRVDMLAWDGLGFLLAREEDDARSSSPFGWSVADRLAGTVAIHAAGGETRAFTGPMPKPGGIAVAEGWVYRRRDEPRMLEVSAGDTVVESNLDAGGATWTWTYRGTQFLNDHDHGRQLQAALFVDTPTGIRNPNEAGAMWSNHDLDVELRHGSPVAAAWTMGSRQRTQAVPLEWESQGFFAPLLWSDVRLGKDLQLDWNGMEGVARYETEVTLPGPVRGHLEMPTAYLRAEFTRVVGVDAVTRIVTELDPLEGDFGGVDYFPPSGLGGVVAATPDGSRAFGIFARTTLAGGQARRFTAHSFLPGLLGGEPDTGQFSAHAIKLRAIVDHYDFPAGTSEYESFVVTGSLPEVVDRMATLAATPAVLPATPAAPTGPSGPA